MSGDVTYQSLKRLSYIPDRPSDYEGGSVIAGQEYYDIYFTGGDISGVTIHDLSAPLPIADGGTGQATANNALNALLPAQAGNAGRVLKTDGSNTSWSADIDTGITQLTGDVTAGPGSGTQAATLATVNANIGSFTNASITVNGKGLITAASSGTAPVTSVSGTANRITSTGGATPVIDISSAYVGQTSITTLGTITTGTWNGTDIAFARIAQVGANTVLTNPTAATADISTTALSASQLLGRGSTGNIAAITLGSGLSMSGTTLNSTGAVPTFQYLTSGTGATYTKPANCRAILVQMVGGGGGGGATATNAGSAGGDTIFNSVNAKGGGGGGVSSGTSSPGGVGGTGGTGTASLRKPGNSGWANYVSASASPGTVFGGGVASGTSTGAGNSAAANTGAGGGGASTNGVVQYGAASGGAGEYVEIYITSPSATYTYTIGAGGNGGAAGTLAGGNGGSGFIKVTEYY